MPNIDETRGLTAFEKAEQAIRHHDIFNEGLGDETALFMCPDDCLFELPYDGGQLSIGDIRGLLDEIRSLRSANEGAAS